MSVVGWTVDVAAIRRVWSCRSRSTLQNGTFWKGSDEM
jgi:hypothetical protein